MGNSGLQGTVVKVRVKKLALRPWLNMVVACVLTGLSRREQILLLVLAIVLALFLGYKYIFVPQYRNFVNTAAQLTRARQQLEQARVTAASLPLVNRRLQEVREGYSRVGDRFAAELRDGGAVVDIGLRAIACGVRITRWQAQDVVAEPYFLELPVDMELRGPYQGVLSFIDSLENRKAEPDLVSIRRLTLETPQENQNGSGQPGTPGNLLSAGGTGPSDIRADLFVIFYSQPTPAGRLALDQVAAWKVGRPDPYSASVPVSPYPGVTPLGLPPESDSTAASAATTPLPEGQSGAVYPGWLSGPDFPGAASGGTAAQKAGQTPVKTAANAPSGQTVGR